MTQEILTLRLGRQALALDRLRADLLEARAQLLECARREVRLSERLSVLQSRLRLAALEHPATKRDAWRRSVARQWDAELYEAIHGGQP